MIRIINVIGILLICSSCNTNTKLVELTVINELQECEEENIFYKIIGSDRVLSNLESARDSLVLLSFCDSLETGINYDLLFSTDSSTGIKVTVMGYFTDKKVNNLSYGCFGASHFIITRILESQRTKMSTEENEEE